LFPFSEHHDDQIKTPTIVSIEAKPPQLNLFQSVRHNRGSQDRHQQQTQMPMMPMGFPPAMMGANFYPGGFMNPWSVQQSMMGQGSAAMGANNDTSYCFADAVSWM
jgi:hypothetical protein